MWEQSDDFPFFVYDEYLHPMHAVYRIPGDLLQGPTWSYDELASCTPSERAFISRYYADKDWTKPKPKVGRHRHTRDHKEALDFLAHCARSVLN